MTPTPAVLAANLVATRSPAAVYDLARDLHIIVLDLDVALIDPALDRLSHGGDNGSVLRAAGEVGGLQAASRWLLQLVDHMQRNADAHTPELIAHPAPLRRANMNVA